MISRKSDIVQGVDGGFEIGFGLDVNKVQETQFSQDEVYFYAHQHFDNILPTNELDIAMYSSL